MIRKSLSIIILISMVLHCSSRLGVISYLYQNRYSISQTIGFITEKPIATCQSNYFAEKDIKIDHSKESQSPASINLAQEIILFCDVSLPINFNNPETGILIHNSHYLLKDYSLSDTSVFHPPATQA